MLWLLCALKIDLRDDPKTLARLLQMKEKPLTYEQGLKLAREVWKWPSSHLQHTFSEDAYRQSVMFVHVFVYTDWCAVLPRVFSADTEGTKDSVWRGHPDNLQPQETEEVLYSMSELLYNCMITEPCGISRWTSANILKSVYLRQEWDSQFPSVAEGGNETQPRFSHVL